MKGMEEFGIMSFRLERSEDTLELVGRSVRRGMRRLKRNLDPSTLFLFDVQKNVHYIIRRGVI